MTNNIDNYGWNSKSLPQSCNYISPFILKEISLCNPKRILDIGSGNGGLCHSIFENGYYICGVEYDKGGVEISKQSYPKIHFYNYGVQDDPNELLVQEKGGQFDLIVSTEVIEHLYSPQLLVKYSHACLSVGGKLIITTPFHGYLKNLALSLFNKWDSHHVVDWDGGHIKFFSLKTIAQLLENNGFKVIKKTGVGRVPYLWKSMVIVAEKI